MGGARRRGREEASRLRLSDLNYLGPLALSGEREREKIALGDERDIAQDF